jgi:hypothetical protein
MYSRFQHADIALKMVELCELKLMSNGVDWPMDIDQRVAQLDFGTSSIEQSLFSSMALDPTIISTDSLDMDTLRMRCETNKNDYKLTFEDSGQWTTSGIGTTPGGTTTSPSDVEADTATNNLTTWGRIHSTELPPAPTFEEKAYSLPELNKRSTSNSGGCGETVRLRASATTVPTTTTTSGAGRRPASLVANFVERQNQNSPTDYEYSEIYVGEGRYVDVNENEIGYVPENTAPLQRSVNHRWQRAQRLNATRTALQVAANALNEHGSSVIPPPSKPPRRTFADLSPSQTAPELNFLTLPHSVPSFCRSSLSLDDMFKKAQQKGDAMKINDCDEEIFETSDIRLLDRNGPDSGFESSSSGPTHIEDWPSLAVLLPSYVAEACSFFKTNSGLLTGSSNNIDRKISQNRPQTTPAQPHPHRRVLSGGPNEAPCRTCFSVRKRIHPPNWAQPANSRHVLCDCCSSVCVRDTTSSEILPQQLSSSTRSRISLSSKLKLHAQELSIIGLPIYANKRNLVERIVEGVAEIARGAPSSILFGALEELLADGLKQGQTPWNVIVEATGPGTATNNVYSLVKEIEASEKPANSRAEQFFKGLLQLYSLDGWLSYVVLKEHVLNRLYADSAFILRANTAYRTLFWRLIESLELLSVLSQCGETKHPSADGANVRQKWGAASKIPSDSRVPKSSSVPSRLAESSQRPNDKSCHGEKEPQDHRSFPSQPSSSSTSGTMRRSRIPVLASRSVSRTRSRSVLHSDMPACSQVMPFSDGRYRSRSITAPLARVTNNVFDSGANEAADKSQRLLSLQNGERVRVLSVRGAVARCCRLHLPRRGILTLMNGAVPTQFLDLC